MAKPKSDIHTKAERAFAFEDLKRAMSDIHLSLGPLAESGFRDGLYARLFLGQHRPIGA